MLANGVVQGGVLAFLMSQQNIPASRAAAVVSFLSLPTMLYCLWSPLTDFLVRRRTWLLWGALLGGLLMALGMAQGDLTSRKSVWLMFAGACLGQLVVSACGGMMGALKTERDKRISGSFYQGGSLAFGALSVFVLISVSEGRHAVWIAPLAGLLIAVPALSALAAPAQDLVATGSFGNTMAHVWAEFKATFLNRRAIPYLLTLGLPLASGSAMSLLPGVARAYGVPGTQVAWMNGLGGALLTALGSLSATVVPARIRASVAYCLIAITNAIVTAILAVGPLRPGTYFLGVTLYLFTVGMAYALFTAVLLEFMGDSGKSGSARYSLINSLGNIPVIYMIALDGWGSGRWGTRGLAGTEAVVGGGAALCMLLFFLVYKPKAVSV